MVLFGKREVAYEVEGNKALWKAAKAVLKEAGIKIMETGIREGEMPIISCGPKIDRRNYGPKGWIDHNIYYISVKPEDVERAKALLSNVGVPI